MLAEVWLKIQGKKKYGIWAAGPIQSFKLKPSTDGNEIAVKVSIEIPDEVFEEPVYEAKITLPKITRKHPDLTEVGKHVAAELSKKMGFRVKVEMPDTTENPHA